MGTTTGALALMALPKIDNLFTLLKGAKYFTALDLHNAYYHIKLDDESIPKSAFTTVFGKFKFLRLPFGLSQGPDFFIQLINDLFWDWTRCPTEVKFQDIWLIWMTS